MKSEREMFEALRDEILAGIRHTPDFIEAWWRARTDRTHCCARLSVGAQRRGSIIRWFLNDAEGC